VAHNDAGLRSPLSPASPTKNLFFDLSTGGGAGNSKVVLGAIVFPCGEWGPYSCEVPPAELAGYDGGVADWHAALAQAAAVFERCTVAKVVAMVLVESPELGR
jgi:hypothetical protein